MLVEMKHVKKHYRDFSLDCSLQLKEGCITGLIGANGAGKSTAFKAILGLIRPEEGEITILGEKGGNLTGKTKEEIGVVLPESTFSRYLKVKQIIPIMKELYSRFDREYFLEQCRRFSIPEDKILKEFSTGMLAKLKILLALSYHPKILILDEPTSGLDVLTRDELLTVLREYMEESEERGILISSHISSDLEGLCDDMYMIDQGKIVMYEETDVLLDEYGILKVSADEYRELDKSFLLKRKKENFGYSCLTKEKYYYMENYPSAVVEKCSLDEVISIMVKGENV
ncbi:MAG: ABC transporter ATP-binding protein [Blautia sp.]